MAENQVPEQSQNPLTHWFRQPKIYVKLPSNGRFYPANALDVSDNGEYPVYAMTAKDELMFKTPDALLSGQSTVEVIKSCIPAIKDPWKMPSIDLDFALIVIRVATYGEKMEISADCPHCKEENNYDVDLTAWINLFNNFTYQEQIEIDPLVVHVRPYTYQEVTKTSIKTLEQQRLFNVINDDSLTDEKKLEMFGKSFVKITELTVDVIAECIAKIDTPNGSTSDKAQIKEFINNCSKDVFNKVSKHVTDLKGLVDLKLNDAECQHCHEHFEIPITMDQSNFFDVKS